MSGISEALVATAVGLLVALPAVAVHNAFGRWLKTIVARSECIGHALASHLKTVTAEPALESPPPARG
jgi:biopolymer transport protein ExbB